MSVDRKQLTAQLQQIGIRTGDNLIVHSSMKSLGPVDGGPEAVIGALLDAVGEAGTVMMPTFIRPPKDDIFDVAATPSWTGLLCETFRKMPSATRSLHPTHSVVAQGARAKEFLEGHEKVSGLGANSPMHRAAQAGAKILMIGCGFASLSIVHVGEAILRMPYLGRVCYPGYGKTLTVRTMDGKTFDVPPIDPPTCSNNFNVVRTEMEARGMIEQTKLADAQCLLFSANDALNTAMDLVRKNPAALLCSKPNCPVCPPARKLVSQPNA